MSTSAAMTTTVTPEQVVEKYITDSKNHPLTLQKFVAEKRDFIIDNLILGEDYKTRWSSIFFKIAKSNNISVEKSKPNWDPISLEYVDRLFGKKKTPLKRSTPTTTTSTSTSTARPLSNATSTSTSSNSAKLSEEDRIKFNKMFTETLNPKNFWRLSTGTVVELKMKELAMNCTHEHPCLSMIFDPADCVWKNYFTEEELVEIEEHNKPVIANLSTEMSSYLKNYKNLRTLTELWEENDKHHFHRINEPDMYWAHTSVSRAIDVLLYNIHEKYQTESDLMKRIWVMIDSCFDAGNISAISGESVSKATTTRVNFDRSLAGLNSMSRQKIGTKTDILFTTKFFEFGTCEAGKNTDINNTKTLYESGMKIPKTLKDMLYVLANQYPSHVHQLKTCGFVISGLNMLPLLMDCPKGYVARVNRPPSFFHYPTCASDFYKSITNILSVIYDAKMVMNDVNELLNDSNESPTYGSRHLTILPPSFIPLEKTQSSKKRKFNNIDSVEEAIS
ncbi:hypothetical protein INT45_010913 [Circinella minor]|uniref:Uncharacterized protein n=1 Tax=Circinella minor TaxID=1195481 RepID=A0A8H7VF88_9FUNG|nr:hypothetical protein INT45_010913 [Circinella minor]